MRNSQFPRWSRVSSLGLLSITLMVGGGCANEKARQGLTEGYSALEQKKFDEAIAKADVVLQQSQGQQRTAEAHYLRGRALEEKTAATPTESKANLQAARTAYIQALQSNPPAKLDPLIRASLGNVAYFQDDYTTAMEQWAASYPKLENPDAQSWVLYRIGLCQQRLGRFEQADQTFAQVQKAHPNTLPAQRAREHQGARNFYVQLATFSSPGSADQFANTLRRQGVTPVKLTDPQGRHLVRVGPMTTYPQAQAMRARFAAQYPDAFIVP